MGTKTVKFCDNCGDVDDGLGLVSLVVAARPGDVTRFSAELCAKCRENITDIIAESFRKETE
jgi:hypothetical protein